MTDNDTFPGESSEDLRPAATLDDIAERLTALESAVSELLARRRRKDRRHHHERHTRGEHRGEREYGAGHRGHGGHMHRAPHDGPRFDHHPHHRERGCRHAHV
ncbi:hypothetical protein [Microbacterium sp. Marseille-Q6648]|uniref:hypothetical protein n=1 Tax=Microbacterium sp. Marseille-Q6648 TaxID=2937991 RepID=UPI00203C849B|nr:hypothetical protein [Microbacterium sp. Marseille-Q6648]